MLKIVPKPTRPNNILLFPKTIKVKTLTIKEHNLLIEKGFKVIYV